MNTKLRQKRKNRFEKDFLKLIDKVVFGKTMENIELVTIELVKHYLLSEPNYHATIMPQHAKLSTKLLLLSVQTFHRNFISNRNEKNSDINK